jgi:hypothetical protein
MRPLSWVHRSIFPLLLAGCQPVGGAESGSASGSSDSTGPDVSSAGVELRGSVQKGPLLRDGAVVAAPLASKGGPDGSAVEARLEDDLGNFTLEVAAGPVALRATGRYFDEIGGTLSASVVELRAVHLASADAPVSNVNVLTHLVERRARSLLVGGIPLADALPRAQTEAVAALAVGPPGLLVSAPANECSLLGADTLDNAYLFALTAVLMQAAHIAAPGAPDAALQGLLDALADDLATDGDLDDQHLVQQIAQAEVEVEAVVVRDNLADYLAGLGPTEPGSSAGPPDLRRALDQDFDGVANSDDNCAFVSNPDQADADGDGKGDLCFGCSDGSADQDGDGFDDACDNCPAVANPEEQGNTPDFHGDPDLDGIGNSCDSCPLSSKTGAVAGENCCDPRIDVCAKWFPLADLVYHCGPDPSGLRFDCENAQGSPCGPEVYRQDCLFNGCLAGGLCVPAGGLLRLDLCSEGNSECDCSLTECVTKWCTVGDDVPCEAGMGCLPWFGPNEAPQGLEALGMCARLDAGPCAGKLGRECVLWLPPG